MQSLCCLLTFMEIYLRTSSCTYAPPKKTGDEQVNKSDYNMRERRTKNRSEPLIHVQQSNVLFRSLNTISLALPHSPSWTHSFSCPMASAVLSQTHSFDHPLANAVLPLPLTPPLLTPIKSNSSHFTILDFPLWLPLSQDNPHPSLTSSS